MKKVKRLKPSEGDQFNWERSMDQPYSIIHQEKFPKGDEDIATPDKIKDWKYL